jgi:hypothetical protein
MIVVAALIVLAYAAVMLLVFALCRVAAESDRQTVCVPLAVVRSGEGGCDEDRNSVAADLARPDHGARP